MSTLRERVAAELRERARVWAEQAIEAVELADIGLATSPGDTGDMEAITAALSNAWQVGYAAGMEDGDRSRSALTGRRRSRR